MAGITLDEAREQLKAWLDASKAVAQNQEYTIGMRRFRRADAAEIRQQIGYWNRVIANLESGGGPRVRYGVPL